MNTALPPALESKLADFRRRVWMVKLLEGVLAGLLGLLASWMLLFILDRVIDTPRWVRWALMVGGCAVPALGLPLKWHRWVWRQRRLEDAARLLRRTFPRLGDQLLGIVELSRHEDASRSERLVQAAMQQAAEAVKDKDFTHAVPNARHARWSWALAGAAALTGAAAICLPDAAWNAVLRWAQPWRDIPRFTFARIHDLPGSLVIPLSEPARLQVTLDEKTTRWSPAQARMYLDGQPAIRAALQKGSYSLFLPPLSQDTQLDLAVGDVRETLQVLPRPRPELTTLAVRMRLPAYLRYQTEPVVEARGGAVSVLKGAQAALEATASRPLASAELDGVTQRVSGEQLRTAFTQITADAEKKVTWKDLDGLEPREPLVLRVIAVADEAPHISARRERPEMVVLDSEVLTFELDMEDDFGVRQAGLEWRGTGDSKTVGEKITAAGEPEKKTLSAKATFCATRDGVEPQTIEVRAWVEDFLPGRKRSYSSAFQLQVLNKTDHALWLTAEFGKWLESARESYEREQQLHATSRELRQMSAADLDRPENRRKISQQASAETANAARLAALDQSGRQLVSQAARNDEFDAARLESWATMLKTLKDISAKRMPSVAELLKQSAGAQKAAAATPAQANPSSTKQANSKEGQTAQKGSKSDSKPAAPQIANGPETPKSGSQSAKAADQAQTKENMPKITDRESSMSKPAEAKNDPNAPPAAPKPSALKLPTTQMAAAAPKEGEKSSAQPPAASSAAQQKMDEALEEQRLLLAEFARVSDELSAILASLEASTFVKRLKKASRDQMVASKDLNTKTLSAFGLDRKPVKDAAQIAEHEKKQSETVRIIQSDLEAYFARKPDMHFKTVIAQMKDTQVVKALHRLGEQAEINLSGSSMAGAEFWADTLDRWAEEMVAASQCKSCSSCSADSLPPEIVLKVMKALQDEMHLRDETRELENARAALKEGLHQKQAADLASKQFGIGLNVRGALDDILRLPAGGEKFGKELKLLDAVIHVMQEAGGILDQPDTGAPAIAAETEAIELLLQAKRPNPKGGGGGGGSPGGGSGSASTSVAALAELGESGDAATSVESRPVGQSTGKAGRELPEEFKSGLDAYFNKLEAK